MREGRQYNLGRVSRFDDHIDIWKGEGDHRIGFTWLENQSKRTRSRQRSGLCNDVFVPVVEGKRIPAQHKRLYIRCWDSDEGSSKRRQGMTASNKVMNVSERVVEKLYPERMVELSERVLGKMFK